MANHSHLQLKLVKTKKGTYVSRWVDPTSGKKGPVVPKYTPSAQTYTDPKAQKLHDDILLYGNAGGTEELKKLSFQGLPNDDLAKLQKLQFQALAHIEGEQKKAQELITAQKEGPAKPAPAFEQLPLEATVAKYVQHAENAKKVKTAVTAIVNAYNAQDHEKLDDLHYDYKYSSDDEDDEMYDPDEPQLAQFVLQLQHKLQQYQQAAAAHQQQPTPAKPAPTKPAVGMTPPKPATPPPAAAKPAGFEPKTKFENSPWMFNAAKYLVSLTNAGDEGKLAAQKVPKNTHKADKQAFLAIQAEGLAYLAAKKPKPTPSMAGAPSMPAPKNTASVGFLANVHQAHIDYSNGNLSAIEALKVAAAPYPTIAIEQPVQQYQQKLIDWLTKQVPKPAAAKKPAKGLGDMLQGKLDKQATKQGAAAAKVAPAAKPEDDQAWSGAPGHRKHAEPKTPTAAPGPAAIDPATPLGKVLSGAKLPWFPHKDGQPMHVSGNSLVENLNKFLDNEKALRKAAKDPAGLQMLVDALHKKKADSMADDQSDLSANELKFNAHVEGLIAQVQTLLNPAPAAGSFKAPVDTAKWPAHNSAAVGAAKKVALIEQLANAGDLVSLKAMTLPHNNAGQNSYGKGVNKAHQAALAHLSGHAPTLATAAAATAPWKPEPPAAEKKAALAVLAPVKAAPEPKQGPGVVVGNLCRDEKGHFIPCSLPGAKPVTQGELGEEFTIGIDTQKWKQGHPSVVQTQKKFAALEAYVAAGDLDGLLAIAPKLGPNPNNYQKAMAAGHALALAYLQAKQGAEQVALATTPEAPVPVPGPAAPVSLKHEAEPTAPHGIDTWKKVGGQLGSNPGAQLVDPTGQKHYVKYSKSNDHARNEVLAARLLELTGVGVVPYTLVSTKPGTLGTATKWTDTTDLPLTPGSAGLQAAQLDFATHAWLANWDVVGMGHDNLKLGPDGQPMCVDTGGALLYRAQGEPKGASFGATCPEWDTMRSISHNSQCAAVFGSMTGAQLVASVEKLEKLDTKLILDAVLTHGPGTQVERELLAAKLLQRRDYLIGKKNALLAIDPTAAASVPAPKPAEPAFNKPAPAAAAPAPTPVAPAFPPTLTEAQLSSKTNPINKKLWGKKVAIDQAVAGFAGGQLTAQQALEALNGPDMAFGVQCYQVKVGKYHADVVAALQQAAVGAVAAPPAPTGTAPAAFSEEWYEQQKPAAVAQGPVAATPSPAALALAAGKAKAAAQADPVPAAPVASDTHAQQAKMLQFPSPPPLDGLSTPDQDALGEMNYVAIQFKAGKITADAAYDELNEHGGFASPKLHAYHGLLTDTFENYMTMGTSYAEAKAEYSLAWSGAPGHRKHATPEGPSVPTHLAPAAPVAPAVKFKAPTYLTEAQKAKLGNDKLQQYNDVKNTLDNVALGTVSWTSAATFIQQLPDLKSGTLTKWKGIALDALHQHGGQTMAAQPILSQSYQVLGPDDASADDSTPAPAKAVGPFSTKGFFVPPTPPTKAELAVWNKAIAAKFQAGMAIVKQADTGLIGWLQASNELHALVETAGELKLKKYLNGAIQELDHAMNGAPQASPAAGIEKAPSFNAPVFLSEKQKKNLGAAPLAQYEQVEQVLAKYAAGQLDNTAAVHAIHTLPELNHPKLTAYKKLAKEALQADYLVKLQGKSKAKKKPVFDAAKLSKPVDFLQWGETGQPGPSNSIHYNQANHNASRLLYKTAQLGDPAKIKALKVMVPNKQTGANEGSQLAIEHPSKWVSGYAQQLLNEIDDQLNPPREITIDPSNPLAALSQKLPKLGYLQAKTAKKIGEYLLLGGASSQLLGSNGQVKTSEQLVGKKIVKEKPGYDSPPLLTYQQHTAKAWAKMPPQQKAAIESFTGGGSSDIVHSFWKGNPSGEAHAAQEALMTLGHEIKPGTLLSRGLNLSDGVIQQLKKSLGSVIQEPAITSTAVNPSVWASKNTQLKITVGPGVKGLYVGEGSLPGGYGENYISSCGGEYEMMLPGGYRLLITKVDENVTTVDADGFGSWEGNKRSIIHCVLLPNT